jgi:hypothetical protein
MARILPPPQFPVAPKEYDQEYLASVVRTFSVFLQQFLSPGEGRNTNLTLTTLQQDGFGLETGALFQRDGFVKIVTIDHSDVRGLSATGGVGSVTVTIE